MKSELSIIESMSLEAIEVACQSAFEEVETVFQVVEKNRNRLEYFGRLLTVAKAKVPHGQWEDWITDTFQGRLKLRSAQLWMSKAQKVALLNSEQSGDSGQLAPRESRKSGRVKVSKPGQAAVQPEPTTEPQDDEAQEVDTQDRPTIRTTPQGTQRVPETKKNPTAALTPVIVEEPEQSAEERIAFAVRELSQVLGQIAEDSERKKTAKQLRKLADELDPPTTGIPKASVLLSHVPETVGARLQESICDWVQYKQGHSDKKYRYQDAKAFLKDLRHMTDAAKASTEEKVAAMLDKAHQQGWRGWDFEPDKYNPFGTKKENGNAAPNLGANGRPPVERSKIIYK